MAAPIVPCPKCGHPPRLHRPSCPSWPYSTGLGKSYPRVCLRVGEKWPECEGHLLVYYVESVRDGWVTVWDVDADTYIDVPIVTARTPWTRMPHRDERGRGEEELRMAGERVTVIRNLMPRGND